jgi:hypothetical protein
MRIARTLLVLAVASFTLPMAGDQLKQSQILRGDICSIQQATDKGRVEVSGQIERVGRQYLISNGGCYLTLDRLRKAVNPGEVYTVQGVLFGSELQDVELTQSTHSIAFDAQGGVISSTEVIPLEILETQSVCLDQSYQPKTVPLGCQRALRYQSLLGEEAIYALQTQETNHEGRSCAFFNLTSNPSIATEVIIDQCPTY